MDRITVLGVRFDALTEDAAVSLVSERIMAHRDSGDVTSAVFTPSPLTVMQARDNPDYMNCLNSSFLSLPDGTGVISASGRLGTPLPERVTGIDTAEGVFRALSGQQIRVYLLGGKPGVAEKAAERLERMYPGLCVCGTHDGYFTDAQLPSVLSDISASRCDFLAVCMGSPKQERFINDNLCSFGAGVAMGLGGALDVWSGNVGRAPAGFILLHLEWLWRMMRQPQRLSKLPRLIKFRLLTKKK